MCVLALTIHQLAAQGELNAIKQEVEQGNLTVLEASTMWIVHWNCWLSGNMLAAHQCSLCLIPVMGMRNGMWPQVLTVCFLLELGESQLFSLDFSFLMELVASGYKERARPQTREFTSVVFFYGMPMIRHSWRLILWHCVLRVDTTKDVSPEFSHGLNHMLHHLINLCEMYTLYCTGKILIRWLVC